MKVFLIAPVRKVTRDFSNAITLTVEVLESQGCSVHWPKRDTNQEDSKGLNICLQNKQAIEEADLVKVIWDGKSEGCLFDLGMAFALGKKVEIVQPYFPEETLGKSFANMVREWENNG